jgi:hypothetical protein
MAQPLQVQALSARGSNAVFVRYSFVAAGGRGCNGAALVHTAVIGGQTLITGIQALNGC